MSQPTSEPTTEQLALIERNRQRALLKQQKKQTSLTTDEAYQLEKYEELKVGANQDTGGGFFIADDDDKTDPLIKASTSQKKDVPVLPDTRENECVDCEDGFSNSFLFSNFGEKICDNCKEMKGRHSLITRTEAKNEYLLSDVDLDKREPPLKCVLKKNPREYAHSYMKLYMRMQVEERAIEVWGSEEALEEERERREGKREGRKRKQFEKQMKDLRMQARSSYYQKRLASAAHEHEFGEEEPFENEDDPDGEYFRSICTTCGLEKKYEKM